MKKSIFSGIITALVFTLSFGMARAQNQEARDRLSQRIHQVNETAKKTGMKVALERVSTETGVPHEEVQAMHKRHPEAGPAGILIASVLADETKKPAEHFLRSALSGKTWSGLAHEHNVTTEKLIERLDRLEKAINPPGDKKEKEKPRKS